MAPPARPRVGFLGPAGTFTEQALLSSAPADAIEPVAQGGIYETFAALRQGDVRWAIAPIENSLDGSISVTLDLLAEPDGGVEIVGEAQLRVRHALIAAEPVELAEIDTVLTHPQVPGQCRRFLRGELAHARVLAGELDGGRRADRRRGGPACERGDRHGIGGEHLRRRCDPRGRGGPRRQRNALRLAGAQ